MSEHGDVNCADQTALNAILQNHVVLLNDNWHTLSLCAKRDSLLRPTTLHFAGDAPWKISKRQDLLSDTAMLWFRYYAHVKGISTWKSLRQNLSPWQIVSKRLFFLVFTRSSPSRKELYFLLKKLGRSQSIQYFEERLRGTRTPRHLIPCLV